MQHVPNALEKAAAALAQAEGRSWQALADSHPTQQQQDDLKRARAVLMALLPTEGRIGDLQMDDTMLEAAISEHQDWADPTDPGALVSAFDAALKTAIADDPENG